MRIPKGVDTDGYLQAKHFCWQYKRYKREYNELANTYNGINQDGMPRGNGVSNPVANAAERREKLAAKIELIEKTAANVGKDLAPYLLIGITEKSTRGDNREISYDDLCKIDSIPLSPASFNALRRECWKEIMQQL